MTAAWAVVLLCGACSDPTEKLERLPHEIAEAYRAGDIEEVVSRIHPSFEGQGLSGPAEVRAALHGAQRFMPRTAYVTAVFLDPSEDEDATDRTLVVLGTFVRGDPPQAGPKQQEPFRVEATARLEDGEWLIVRAKLIR